MSPAARGPGFARSRAANNAAQLRRASAATNSRGGAGSALPGANPSRGRSPPSCLRVGGAVAPAARSFCGGQRPPHPHVSSSGGAVPGRAGAGGGWPRRGGGRVRRTPRRGRAGYQTGRAPSPAPPFRAPRAEAVAPMHDTPTTPLPLRSRVRCAREAGAARGARIIAETCQLCTPQLRHIAQLACGEATQKLGNSCNLRIPDMHKTLARLAIFRYYMDAGCTRHRSAKRGGGNGAEG